MLRAAQTPLTRLARQGLLSRHVGPAATSTLAKSIYNTGTTHQTRAFSLFEREKLPSNFGVLIVPQQHVWVIERFGKFQAALESGLHFRIPFIDRVAYTQSLKETVIDIPHQNAITKDNVQLSINGVLYLQVHDAYKASYHVENAYRQSAQLAQTTMRSEIGKMSFDETFSERITLNHRIVQAIDSAAEDWGIKALRYEIKDITPSELVLHTMESQSVAERRRREVILDAEGDAEALLIEVEANADAISRVARVMDSERGYDAGALRIADEYVKTFSTISESAKTVVLPKGSGAGNGAIGDANTLASAAAVFQSMNPGTAVHTVTQVPASGQAGQQAGEGRSSQEGGIGRDDLESHMFQDDFLPRKKR